MSADAQAKCLSIPNYETVLIYPSYNRARTEFRDAAFQSPAPTGSVWNQTGMHVQFANGSRLVFFGCDETGDVYRLQGLRFDAIEFPGWEPELAVEMFARNLLKKVRAATAVQRAVESLELDL